MRNIEYTGKIISELNRNRLTHPHPKVRQRMTVLWAWSRNFCQHDCALMGHVSDRTVRRYLDEFEEGGLERLLEIRWNGRARRLEPYVKTLEAEFLNNPVRTVAEAGSRIKELCGVQLQPTQTRAFLHSLGLRWRKIAAIPVPPKKTIEEHIAIQKEFLTTTLNPLLDRARAGLEQVFFVDAAHFVLGMFLCCLWSKFRLFIKSSSGRQRFNVLGAWNAITHKFVFVSNITVVNQETFCELLHKLAELNLGVPITLILDNARYQKCRSCFDCAEKLGIRLQFLPSYSPNLNLIERIWKFIKKECLYGRHFPSFANFRSRIEDCINGFDSTYSNKLNSLMTLNFQTFENRSILAA